MAAAAPEMFSEQELTCSICLDLFSEPVSTPCGHNFCQACIGGYWASSAACSCPLCKRHFEERPQLSVNRVFALITNKYKETHYGMQPLQGKATGLPTATGLSHGGGGSTNPFLGEDVAGSGAVAIPCDLCTGRKQAAVRSCLTCTASYCQEHVQPHHSSAFYASHRLLDPRQALEGRTCPLHQRLLEVFCRSCQRCICAICVLEEHRTHKTVSVQTERLEKLMSRMEMDLQSRTERKSLRLTELNSRMASIRSYALGEQGELESLLADVSRSVERIRSELIGGIQDKYLSVESKGAGLVRRLEVELKALKENRAKLETHATSQDHIGFIQSFEEVCPPLGAELEEVEAESDLSLLFQLGGVKAALQDVCLNLDDVRGGEIRPRGSRGSLTSLPDSESMVSVRRSSSSLKKSLGSLKELKKVKSGSGMKKIRSYLEDVALNPVTAYPFLILSEDRKQVKRGEKLQFYRNSQHRFDVWSCVLAKEGFNTGRHYWEVTVGENKDWKVGVVQESAQRKGLFDMSPTNGYFTLWWGGGHLRALTNPPLTKVKTPSHLTRVGVYLDCEEGQVTFINAKTRSELYSFSSNDFGSQKMMPMLGTGDREVPLVLSATAYNAVPE
ncbi:bloodthirsty-related gene family, member 30 [Aplochiton taeniatus]